MYAYILIAFALAFSASGFFLKHKLKFAISFGYYLVPFLITFVGVVIAFQLRDMGEAVVFFVAALTQFATVVFNSRLRQRSSFFWQVIGGLAANFFWYLTFHYLKMANDYPPLFILYMIAITSGRATGASWSQYIEDKYKLIGDANKDKRLSSAKEMRLIAKEKIFWFLAIGLALYWIYGILSFSPELIWAMNLMIGLTFVRSLFYAFTTRAVSRGNDWFIASSSLISGVIFYVITIYLFRLGMPLLLLVPYAAANTLGSTVGTFFSMIIERFFGISPDSHLDKPKGQRLSKTWKNYIPYLVILLLGLTYLFSQEQVFNWLGIPIETVTSPLPFFKIDGLSRIAIFVLVAIVVFVDESMQVLMSRAGSRSHAGYHMAVCFPKGFADFTKMNYLAMGDTRKLDVLPIIVLTGVLANLVGKNVSEKIEKRLKARMDINIKPDKPVSEIVFIK